MIRVRYYTHFAADPFFNMAFDEWMFASVLKGDGPACLRLYSWDPGAITFGYNQDYARAVDSARLSGTPAIRRISGGRALFHDPSELTYSLAFTDDSFGAAGPISSASASAAMISEILVDFLRQAGIESSQAERSSRRNAWPDFFHKAPCFESLARYEVVSGGRKVVASAQRRLDRVVFQHGSIKIGGVASHPALSWTGKSEGPSVIPEPLSKEAFVCLDRHFQVAFESVPEWHVVACEPDAGQSEALEKRLNYVKNNFENRRDIF